MSGKRRKPVRKDLIGSINYIGNEFRNFKVNQGHKMIDLEHLTFELRRENVMSSFMFGALLDVLSDISSVPNKIINERFMFYIQEREIIDSLGNAKGELSINKFNF